MDRIVSCIRNGATISVCFRENETAKTSTSIMNYAVKMRRDVIFKDDKTSKETTILEELISIGGDINFATVCFASPCISPFT